ncbi:ecdysteroid-regulated 16 kDa protein-like [Phlebotomus argentipes]|uniref:ecdysteroid-regulated 16 kDa protein-like n=1 Tax=Phlebotomus argentipes TaxID=94469 RepID=UPI0028932664|nr:ecdysteroid-regulated 16 kDa protein-like [Phlebotomus argentipes]XP_059610656.1 ecdysteroid-regulated 16 kDa protein-like [Phlebotomus argentipes]XP_059610657.1 ecdysteroid-regulated 16 kDa protein-like [Phlebotomus argentipes]XP_059610658.1 ecdysteroid-regulated 16 kDa protein-like [Phlebotomus argentipes]
MKFSIIAVTFAFTCFVSLSQATQVRQCQGGAKKLESSEVSISNCDKPPCKLRRKTDVTIEQKLTPEKDIDSLTTAVHAEILNLPLPFIGVDGTSACENIFEEDGTTKSGCPLKAGKNYVYKNSFKVYDFYPKTSLVVHWALQNSNKDVTCFEVPAKII